MAVKLFTKKIGERTFAFGNLALRRFTEALGCAPNIVSVHAAMSGDSKIGAIIEMVKAGVEQGSEEMITEYEAASIVDSLTDKQQADLLETFFSSIVGEPFAKYLDKLKKEIEATETGADQAAAPDEPGKSSVPASAGKDSKKGPTPAS